jgi:hypothetical protein
MFEGESDDHTAYWFNVNWHAQNWSAWFGVNNENGLLTPNAWPDVVAGFGLCFAHRRSNVVMTLSPIYVVPRLLSIR